MKDQKLHKHFKHKITKKCKGTKEIWLDDSCQEIEKYILTFKTDRAFRKIKQNFREIKNSCGYLRGADGNFEKEKDRKSARNSSLYISGRIYRETVLRRLFVRKCVERLGRYKF